MKIGIADTTFSRVDMHAFAEETLKRADRRVSIERYTVPGVKDLPVACKRLFDFHGCDIVMALGMVGPMPVDKQCGHEASLAIQMVQLMTGRHVIEVFIHMDEAKDDRDLLALAKNRTTKHALNAIELLKGKEALSKFAGTGRRQGRDDAGPAKVKAK
jgi:riboflavin synthase